MASLGAFPDRSGSLPVGTSISAYVSDTGGEHASASGRNEVYLETEISLDEAVGGALPVGEEDMLMSRGTGEIREGEVTLCCSGDGGSFVCEAISVDK